MKNNHYKFLAVVGFAALLFVVIGFKPQRFFTASGADADTAAVYKTKCSVCHTAKAEKFFDLSKTDEHHVEIILNGKKDAKPPMPAFATKGITPEQAKALVAHMRNLRTPGAANANANSANVNPNANGANPNANTGGNANTNANTNVSPNANTPVNANANKPVNVNTTKPVNANVSKPGNVNKTKPVNTKAKPNE